MQVITAFRRAFDKAVRRKPPKLESDVGAGQRPGDEWQVDCGGRDDGSHRGHTDSAHYGKPKHSRMVLGNTDGVRTVASSDRCWDSVLESDFGAEFCASAGEMDSPTTRNKQTKVDLMCPPLMSAMRLSGYDRSRPTIHPACLQERGALRLTVALRREVKPHSLRKGLSSTVSSAYATGDNGDPDCAKSLDGSIRSESLKLVGQP